MGLDTRVWRVFEDFFGLRPPAEDRIADLTGQVDDVFSLIRLRSCTKIRAIKHDDRVADVVSVEGCELAFRLLVRDGGEAYWANGVERAIPILPVRKGRGTFKGHRAASFLGRP